MSTTDDTKTSSDGAGAPPPKRQPPWMKAAKRYGPIAVVVALIGGAVLVFGGGGGGDDDDDAVSGGGGEVAAQDELIRSGPMTPAKAELEGEANVDFGPNCDTERGTLMIVTVHAPPCVEPFEGDNGGATSPGVTADTVKVVYYQTDPVLDPLTAATVGGAGADTSMDTAIETVQGFADLYNKLFETYERTVDVEVYVGTGAGDDLAAAKADAIAIADQEPFAVIGGPQQASPVFAAELASRGIICGPLCATGLPEELVDEYEPLIWQALPTPDQGVAAVSGLLGNLLAGGTAELAGDPAMHDQDRVYGLLHYDTPNGDHQPVFEEFERQLADNGIELATDIEFTLDLAKAQENSRTMISRLKAAGVTTIIYYGDPFTPGPLTKEATAQDYQPEWVLGPSVLMDTTIFARLTDMEQWSHGFGVSPLPARGERSTNGAFRIYEWAYGEPPPNNTANILNPPVFTMFQGIHMSGPELTPETFRDGLFRLPATGGSPTEPQVSRGDHGFYPDTDWGGFDDGTLIWFDPEATGEDEVGNQGTGMYRYAKGGQRYTFGNGPESIEDAGLFDVEASITVYDEVPAEDQTPDYPPPE